MVRRRRRVHFLWFLGVLALCAVGAQAWRDAQPPPGPLDPRAQEALRAMCTWLDGMTDFTATLWFRDRSGELSQEGWYGVIGDEESVTAFRRQAWETGARFTCRREGGRFPGRGGEERVWFPAVPGSLRDATGVFFGVPEPEDRDLPGRRFHDLPYTVGSIVQADTYAYLMAGVTASRWEGYELVQVILGDSFKYPCVKLGFHQATLDWDLWIEAHGPPRPRRLQLRMQGREGRTAGRTLDVFYQDW